MARIRASQRSESSLAAASPASVAVSVHGTNEAALRPAQLQFNRLTRQIATLEKRIAAERERLNELLGRFLIVVGPVETDLATRRIELARALSSAQDRWPLRKKEFENLRLVILRLLDDAFAIVRPDADDVTLRARWSFRSTDERAHHASIKKKLREEFRAEFGFDADVLDDGDDSAEGFARFRFSLEEEVRKADEEAERAKSRRTRKEGRRKQRATQESVRLRSVRAIYLALAKILHPDARQSAEDRAERERDMKRAAEAYRQEDLVTLLRLDQRWGGPDARELADLTDDVLEVYVASLRQRVAALGNDLELLRDDARFAAIRPIVSLTRTRADAEIRKRAAVLGADLEHSESLLNGLAGCRGKRDLVKFIGNFLYYDEDLTDRLLGLVDDIEAETARS